MEQCSKITRWKSMDMNRYLMLPAFDAQLNQCVSLGDSEAETHN